MKRILLLLAFLACGDASAFKPGALGGHSGLGRKCGALGNCGGSAYGFPKSAFVLVATGNSLTAGTDTTLPWTTQLGTMLTASGVSYTLTNAGHGANCTVNVGACPADLITRIPAEVDPLFDSTKNNVLILQEVINELANGSTGAAAYAHVTQYFNALANPSGWYKIVIMPTPCHSPGCLADPTFETDRQAFISLVNADPTFGGTVHAVWRVDQDTRLGPDAAADDSYYYLQSGGTPNKVHWVARADGIAAASIMTLLRAKDEAKFPFIPQHAPYAAGLFSASVTGSVLTSSGGVATNGQAVATWNNNGSLESGNLVQATGARQPVYNSTGFGGLPSINLDTNVKDMVSASSVTLGRGTMIVTANATTGGFVLAVPAAANDKRMGVTEVAQTVPYSTYEYNGAAGALQTQANGTVLGASHVVSFVFNGTKAGQVLYVDGISKTLTQYSTFGGNSGDTPAAATLALGATTNSMVGNVGDIFVSPIPLTNAERYLLENYFGSRRGITVAP